MKKIPTTLFLALLTLFSCVSKSQQFEKQIIGEWTLTRSINENIPVKDTGDIPPPPPPPPGNYTKGYIFEQNGTCEDKNGFFRLTRKAFDDTKVSFLGTKTRFIIVSDSLKIFDRSTYTWNNTKIYSIKDDSLILKTEDDILEIYTKQIYHYRKNESYDKIIVSSSGCYGPCPIADICIERDGNVIYYGQRYNNPDGLFTSKISKKEYLNIETSFKKADIPNLKENYIAGGSDMETITMTFIKNNKIVKTITDYGHQSPAELIWAYSSSRFLYENLKLVPYIYSNNNNYLLLIRNISFKTNQKIYILSKSEGFYLKMEFFNGKEVSQKFEKKYKIEYYNPDDKKEIIYSDGRYFTSTINGVQRTIDLGYNFLTQNDLIRKFRKINNFD